MTEPNTGLGTARLRTRAARRGDRSLVNGQTVRISAARVAEKVLGLPESY